MEKIYFVYLLTFANGKVYVGMSQTDKKGLFTSRYNNHANAAKKGKDLLIYRAWRKYGPPVQTILSTHATRDECALAEIDAIKDYDSLSHEKGYNIMGGGQGQMAGCNPRIYEIMRQKCWDNVEWRKKVSASLKGRKPSQAAIDAYKEFCKTPMKSEVAKIAWRDPAYRAMKSESTKIQMANGGAEHLSKKFKGRGDIRSEEGKRAQREKIKQFFSTPEGKAAARRGYEAFASNPENLAKAMASLANWRKSDKNAEHCKAIAKKAAAACSKKVMDPTSGVVYNSQREMARALGVNESCISTKVKEGAYLRVQ